MPETSKPPVDPGRLDRFVGRMPLRNYVSGSIPWMMWPINEAPDELREMFEDVNGVSISVRGRGTAVVLFPRESFSVANVIFRDRWIADRQLSDVYAVLIG